MAKVYTLQKEHQRKLSEMKEEKESLLEKSTDLDRMRVEKTIHELSQTYRHLGLHLETMERFMEDDVGTYIEERAKIYESMIETAEKELKKIPKRKAEPYRQRILCLKILRDSLYLEGVESSSVLYHLAQIDEEIYKLENSSS